MPPSHYHVLTTRRALGVAIGVGGAAALLSSTARTLQLPPPPPTPCASAPPSSQQLHTRQQQPIMAASSSSPPGLQQQQQQPAPACGGGGQPGSGSGGPPPKAVNLRDIGEVNPRLRRGVLFRCSQIYSPEVLRELRIKTVVDLRGRTERASRKKGGPQGSKHVAAAPVGPPTLLPPDAIDQLGVPAGGGAGAAGAGTAAAEPAATMPPPAAAEDVLVTRLNNHLGPLDSGGSVDGGGFASGEEATGAAAGALPAAAAPPSSEAGGSNHNGSGAPRALRASPDDMAAALGEQGDWQQPEREAFNVIPGRQFGYAMLRMPPRVWRAALGNLVAGRDPRRPFVDAFADEQLLGFTRYYKLILEHSKPNIAAVLRVFARSSNLPSLVHCAHGKDRTGVIIMLLLLACDIPHEAIVADYVQSEVELRRYRAALGLPDPTGATGAVIPLNDVIIASTAETLRALLAYMSETYITVDNYLSSCGLSSAEVAAIRSNLLQPAGRDGPVAAAGGGAGGAGGAGGSA